MGESQNVSSPSSKEERTWAMLCHLSALAGLVIPFGNIIGPLVIWLIQKDKIPAVNEHGKESLNFQITWSIAGVIAAFLTVIVIGFILLPAIGIFVLIMVIIASLKANNGESYQYPASIKFIK